MVVGPVFHVKHPTGHRTFIAGGRRTLIEGVVFHVKRHPFARSPRSATAIDP
ncbi:hypothetical protein GCM10010497_39490 [Streptomyces cinereoruber]|uniref:Uncharacterized protein n=1 Tax=Streptomyces cinereoruber TaxID=67260 RepID=A0AAV4KLL6_9ACTN|nr:hypothetical protein [Streptomyces cinereoruber]NIH60458.1 hypothetical protein [Streptomyces cinereoruber]GGR32992.1 hypothetical protein GCM10010497_39490 [Streptomyces cinereoruber]